MAEIASAYVTLIPSFRGGANSIRRELDGPLDQAGRQGGQRFGGGMVSGITGMAKSFIAPIAAAFAGVQIVDFFKDAISGASDLNESSTKIAAIFGDAAGAVQDFAAGGAKALGQTKLAVLDAAATFGTFGKSAQLTGPDLASFSTGLATLSTDLASFYNTSPEQAVQAIGAALRGESEPIRQFGVLLDDATLRNRALALGLISTTKDALTPQQKVLAAQAEIMAQTADAQGDFQRTSGGLANQQRILSASFEDVKTQIGAALLPAMTGLVSFLAANVGPAFETIKGGVRALAAAFQAGGSDVTSSGFAGAMERIGLAARVVYDWIQANVVPVLRNLGAFITGTVVPALRSFGGYLTGTVVPAISSFVGWLVQNREWLEPIAVGILAIVAALKVYGMFLAAVRLAAIAYATAQGILNAVMSANPIGLIVLAIVGLVAALVYAWNNSETFRNIVMGAWNAILAGVTIVVDWFKTAIPAAFEWVKNAFLNYTPLGLVISHWGQIQSFVMGVVDWLKAAPAAAFQFIKNAFERYTPLGIIISHWEQIKTAVGDAITGVIDFVKGLPGRIVEGLGNLGQLLYTAGKNVIDGLINGIKDKVGAAVQAVKDAVGAVIDGAKNLLGIKSPSRVFMEIGRYTGQGLALGIEGERGAVEAATARMVSIPSASRIGLGSVGVGGPGGAFPAQMTLVDADGSILARTRVIASGAVGAAQSRALNVARRDELAAIAMGV